MFRHIFTSSAFLILTFLSHTLDLAFLLNPLSVSYFSPSQKPKSWLSLTSRFFVCSVVGCTFWFSAAFWLKMDWCSAALKGWRPLTLRSHRLIFGSWLTFSLKLFCTPNPELFEKLTVWVWDCLSYFNCHIKNPQQKPKPNSALWPDSTCGAGGRWDCEQNACLIEPDVIHAVNRGNYGYKSKSSRSIRALWSFITYSVQRFPFPVLSGGGRRTTASSTAWLWKRASATVWAPRGPPRLSWTWMRSR